MSSHERDNHVMFELRSDPKSSTGKSVGIKRPTDVLPIHDKEELQLQLDHYKSPFLKHVVPDSTFARKNYILYVRPALRYYCAKFGVTVPDWLKTDAYYENLPDTEKQDLFGTTKLRFNGQFSPVNQPTSRGQVHRGDKIEILDAVYFRTDKADIRSKSFKLLDNVAGVLKSHPTLTVRVEGHTDSQGDDAHNLDLSQRRAQSVVAYLVKKGVAAERLTAQGFGETAPIADNRTNKGRAANRRVVFAITGGADGTVQPAPTAPATPSEPATQPTP